MNTPTINKKNSKKTQKVTKTPPNEQISEEEQRYIYDTFEKNQKVTTTLSHEPLSEEEQQHLMNLHRQYEEEFKKRMYFYDILNNVIRFLTMTVVPIMILIKYRFIGIIVVIFYYIMVFFINISSFPCGTMKFGILNYLQFMILYFTLLAIIYRFTPTP